MSEHPDSSRIRAWRKANPERYAEQTRRNKFAQAARNATPEGRRHKQEGERRRYHANKARYAERAAARYRRNAETIKSRVRARAAVAKFEGFRGVLRRDPCAYCGGDGGTLDHIVPTVAGGADSEDNLTGACKSCNSRKKERPLLVALLDVHNDTGPVRTWSG